MILFSKIFCKIILFFEFDFAIMSLVKIFCQILLFVTIFHQIVHFIKFDFVIIFFAENFSSNYTFVKLYILSNYPDTFLKNSLTCNQGRFIILRFPLLNYSRFTKNLIHIIYY